MEYKNKVGRPIKAERTVVYQSLFNFDEQTNSKLLDLVDKSNLSKTGVARLAIDYLYYRMSNQELPDDMTELLEFIKNNKIS